MGRVARRLSSYAARVVMSPRRKALMDGLRERVRRLSGEPHRIVYFHEVDDPYSHLAAQTLAPLAAHYAVAIEPRVASLELGMNRPEPELLARHARRDCALVAPHYGLEFPAKALAPDPTLTRLAERLLVAAESSGIDAFAERAVAVGRALFSGDTTALDALGRASSPASEATTRARLDDATRARAKLGHFGGAAFLYGGEWFWGVDRLHHLERRLTALGAARGNEGFAFGRPPLETAPVARADEMTLEIFPSLRSPYSAIGYEPALDLAKATGVRQVTRPVLPMVMRGVPVSLAKGLYIFRDARREGAALGMPFGRMIDPIGTPVRRAFALWPWARSLGRGEAFVASFLRAAFAEAVDTSSEAGLRRVVERAGLAWSQALPHLGSTEWETELEQNRICMIEEMGQWGVPSFRLRGPGDERDLVVWGQDRLWLISREIQRRGGAG